MMAAPLPAADCRSHDTDEFLLALTSFKLDHIASIFAVINGARILHDSRKKQHWQRHREKEPDVSAPIG